VAIVRELGGLEPADEVRVQYAIACARAAIQLVFAGAYEMASTLSLRAESVATGLRDANPLVTGWVERCTAARAVSAGDDAGYLRHTVAGANAFEAAGDVRTTWAMRCNAGHALAVVGDYESAVILLRQTATMCERHQLTRLLTFAQNNLGLALLHLGAHREAMAMEDRAIEAAVAQGDRRLEGFSRIYRAMAASGAGELSEAAAEIVRAVAALETTPPARAFARAVQTRIELARGHVTQAMSAANEAMETLKSLGKLDAGESVVRLAYVEALRASGADERANEMLTEATQRLFERAAKISDPIQRESFLRRVPEQARTLALAGR
jgi:tetratricopeptide (TPR) repeat protein